jgi:hypothetical protein
VVPVAAGARFAHRDSGMLGWPSACERARAIAAAAASITAAFRVGHVGRPIDREKHARNYRKEAKTFCKSFFPFSFMKKPLSVLLCYRSFLWSRSPRDRSLVITSKVVRFTLAHSSRRPKAALFFVPRLRERTCRL